jgi:ATP-binding cassette subfamily F protein 3
MHPPHDITRPVGYCLAPMLHVNDLTYRIEGRTILDKATVGIPSGHKVGLVGRNGSGKTTLLRLIDGELHPDDGSVRVPRTTRIGRVTQEAPGGPDTLIDFVLAADRERMRLLAEAETANDAVHIADVHERLAHIDAHSAPARAARILAGLGFDEAAQHRPCAEYSGGWRMRVALAAMLFTEPDLLLLDEPTNYLDLEGTLWLEDYLRSYPHTVVIVSHDRELLNRSVTSILHLSQGKLTLYSGGYDQFEEARREKQRLDLKLKKKQDDERRRIEAFITRFKAKASKASQAQSRVKALARMQPIAEQIEERVVPFLFPNPAKPFASPLIRLEGAAVGYDGDPVLRNLDLRLDADDRVGLLGANGNGKSTFARLLAGRLAPMAGRRYASDKIVVGYFAQHQMEDLPAGKTPYQHMLNLMPDATEAQRRARLGALGFGVDKADTKAENLSGGEKARLLFALATFHGPHLLILDEPTNHLDVDAREALVRALNDYEGAVILISHDRHLMDACADRLWVVRNGTVQPYDGDMDSYRAECLAERGTDPKAPRSKSRSNGPARPTPQEARRQAAEQRAAIAPLKQAVARAEAEIDRLTKQIAAIDAALADTALYSRDLARAQGLARERAQLARSRAAAESRWLDASEAYEAARLDDAEQTT